MSKIKIRIVLYAVGIYYIVFPAIGLLMNKMQMQMAKITPYDNGFSNIMGAINETWNTFFPLLIVLGICYIFFGMLYPLVKKMSLLIHTLLTSALAVWCYYYIISGRKFIQILLDSYNLHNEMISEFMDKAYSFGIIAMIVFFALPQIMIFILIIFKQKLKLTD